MPQLRPAFVLLASLASSACVVSFDGYELGATDASTGGSGNAGTGGSVGGNGGSVGGTSGVGGSLGGGGGASGGGASGGTGGVGAEGGTGGVVTGGGGASGSGGSTGGNGGTTGGGTGGGTGGSPPTCPSQGGPMTAVPQVGGGFYCVDKTEVTQTQYQAFLGTNPNSLTQITECTGQSFTPSGSCNGWNPGSFGQRPAVCVDWCDAYGFCKYVGKHLCGAIDTGNPVTTAQATDETIDEWYNACSAGGTQLYPYANLYDGSTCNGLNAGLTNPANVLFFAACIGGYPGLNDMSGNVREWTNSCSGSNCLQRGGSWLDGSSNLTCTATTSGPRMEVNDRIGFRCCAQAN